MPYIWRFSDNHDERRAIARFGEPAALAASALVFTLDGVPMLYNGMEVGDTTESGAPAFVSSGCQCFGRIVERRPEFARFYKQIIALRRSDEALKSGTLEWLRNSDECTCADLCATDKGRRMLVAINLSSRPFFGNVEVSSSSGYEEITPDVNPPLPPDTHPPRTFGEQATGWVTCFVAGRLGLQVLQKSRLSKR
jgi:glycosidase